MNNPLGISWHDSAWIPNLNAINVLDYFSERSNPFYDRTCNNEIVKMQRLSPEQLTNMTGLEYILLHVQEPILYVIRKQHRHSSSQVTPIADYYIIAGIVYQAPDLSSVVNSRLLSTVNHMQSAFDEILSYSRYHPSKGYTWEFKDKDLAAKFEKKKEKKEKKEEPSSLFQRQRVDMLLGEIAKKFPLRVLQPQVQGQESSAGKLLSPADDENPKSEGNAGKGNEQQQNSGAVTIKQEKMEVNGSGSAVDSPAAVNTNSPQTPNQQRIKPPPEKRPRIS